VVPCGTTSLIVELVVTDNHGLDSAVTQHVVAVQEVLGPWISINDCTAGDECGTEERPWCSITAAYTRWPQITSASVGDLRVVRGRYEQGTTALGGVSIATPGETLVWNDTGGTEPHVEGYAALGGAPLSAGSCDQWDTTPTSVAVVVHDAAGWQVNADADVELDKLCVVGRPASSAALDLFSALTFTSNASRFHNGVVRTDTVGAPLPLRSYAVYYSTSVPASSVALFEDSIVTVGSGVEEAGGVLIAPPPMLPILFTGTVRIDRVTVSFGNASSAKATFGVLSFGDVTEILSSKLSGGPGSDESYGVYAEGQDELTVAHSEVYGLGLGVTTGVFTNLVDTLTVEDSTLRGRQDSSVDVMVRRATGLHVRNGAQVDLLANGAAMPDLIIEGAGAMVSATRAAQGIYVESLQSGGNPGELTLTGPASGGFVHVQGGNSTSLSTGIEVESGIVLTVENAAEVLGGVVWGPSAGGTPTQSVAAGIRLRGQGGTATIHDVGLIQGCAPNCYDRGVSLGSPGISDERSLLGVGLFADASTNAWPPTNGSWSITVSGDTDVLGGAVELAPSATGPTAELIGIRALGDYAGGHVIVLDGVGRIVGTPTAAAPDVPWRSAGIRLARSSVDATAPFEIVGGPARAESRGVWMTNAHPSGTTAPAGGAAFQALGTDASAFAIRGNPQSDTGLRPMAAYGVDDQSNFNMAVANQLAIAAYPPTDSLPWSTVEGGWVRANMQGTVIGVRLDGTTGVILEHVRMHGGAVPGGLVQNGLYMNDLATPAGGDAAYVNGCLIEACGYTEGNAHHPSCHAPLFAFSVGVEVDAADRRRWPLEFTNNLVFGGYNTYGAAYGSTGMVVAVDEEPGGVSNTPV
ncbi:MAG: hypothetical protein ACYC6C_14540, partial [Coriobacteriia bacterium]